jgi:hypothetical protein
MKITFPKEIHLMRVLTVPVLAMLAVSCADLTNRPPINEGFFSDALDGPNERLCVRTTTPERPLTDGQALSASAIIVCSPSVAGGEAIEPPPHLRIDIRTEKAENVVVSADGIFHAESGHIAGLWATISSSAASEEFTGDLYWLPDAGSESHTLPDAALAGYGLAYSGLFIDGCLTPETVELTLEAHVNFVHAPGATPRVSIPQRYGSRHGVLHLRVYDSSHGGRRR